MSQLQWTYVADSGQQYHVVLHHGGRSGHVLVTVNQKVSIIDFYVRKTKSYNILLEDELFLLELEKGPKGFGYAFAIDKQADTERNKARRKLKNRSIVWITLGVLVFFGIVGSLAAGMMNWQERLTLKRNLPLLDEIGEVTYGRVARQDDGSWTLFFTEGPMIYELALDSSEARMARLQQGDDQGVRYLKGNPKVCRVDWAYCGPQRASRLLALWMENWEVDPPEKKECLRQAILENRGWLTHPDAPWLRANGGTWADWLALHHVSVREGLDAKCGSIQEVE